MQQMLGTLAAVATIVAAVVALTTLFQALTRGARLRRAAEHWGALSDAALQVPEAQSQLARHFHRRAVAELVALELVPWRVVAPPWLSSLALVGLTVVESWRLSIRFGANPGRSWKSHIADMSYDTGPFGISVMLLVILLSALLFALLASLHSARRNIAQQVLDGVPRVTTYEPSNPFTSAFVYLAVQHEGVRYWRLTLRAIGVTAIVWVSALSTGITAGVWWLYFEGRLSPDLSAYVLLWMPAMLIGWMMVYALAGGLLRPRPTLNSSVLHTVRDREALSARRSKAEVPLGDGQIAEPGSSATEAAAAPQEHAKWWEWLIAGGILAARGSSGDEWVRHRA